jgi:hypothetical protein
LPSFPHTADDVVGHLSRIFRGDVRIDDDTIFFKVKNLEVDIEFPLQKARLQSLLTLIAAKEISDETGLYSETIYEIIVSEEGRYPSFRMRDDYIRVSDAESGMTYEVSPASDEYLLWLVCTASTKGSLRDLGFGTVINRHRLSRELGAEPQPMLSVFDVLRLMLIRTVTLKLVSSTKQSLRRFQTATYSFLFHLAYNLDLALVPQRFLEEVSRRGRISRIRRSTPDELDPPRRSYNEDLVNHYILATSTDSPTIQFLSYYHVLEHFFESVFNDDLVEQIKTSITQPGFSYKRKKDVGQLINTIKKSLQIRSETITFSESEALRLSLVKFIDITQLVNKLDEYDPALVDYYASNEVPFSKGATVALRSGDSDRIAKDLTRRIYATRNSLVHSKDGDKARYIPFKDERSLVSEVPLMRFISEMVILAVSEIT